MSNKNVLSKPLIIDTSFVEFYETFAADWEKRAVDLRTRRWKQLQRKLAYIKG